MYYSTKELFYKCWLWSVICGVATAILFWFLTSLVNVFHWEYGGTVFMDLLITLSVVGSYLGAGYVGWRIVEKYYPSSVRYFIKQYRFYSIISFVALIIITFTPLSILGFFWSVLAPGCVIMVLSKLRKDTRVVLP